MKKTQVIIVGAGPTGVMLAHLLGQKNISVILIEKEADIFPVTRATHLDAETLRNLQMTGLINELKEYTQSITYFDVVDKDGKTLFEQALANQDTVHHYKDDCFFDQVYFEKILRKGLARYSNVELIVGAEAIDMIASGAEVKIGLKTSKEGGITEVTGDWLIGCDGGRSFVRETMFPKMRELKPPKDWILVDTALNNAEDARLLPDRFRYYLSDERLTAYAHGFGLNRRWEFELNEGETMPEEAVIKSWVEKFIDLNKISFLRIKKYTHLSLVTPKWQENNVFLAGDAAHLMPPFAGQGLCSGVRDAVNLAWKLSDVIQNKAKTDLLNSYDTERQVQIKHTFNQTHSLMQILLADTKVQKWRRKTQLQSIQLLPPKLKAFLQKSFSNPKSLTIGCVAITSKLCGQHLPQFVMAENRLSDDEMSYKWALIYAPSIFAKEGVSLDIENIHLIPSADIWEEWLKANKIDFAFIRPDKIIFGAGKIHNWKSVYEEYRKWEISN
ncbi:MAG: FAD-dependent monooxygenase [Saprospiraceae bacterium]|nr:FAD-dependent monooxygenase [Saprospiraceae bacterium]